MNVSELPKLTEALGWQCPRCAAYHEPPECDHDPGQACRYCTLPVGNLSTGGPDVCSLCEVYGVPPAIYMGWKPAYDFHTSAGRKFLSEAET